MNGVIEPSVDNGLLMSDNYPSWPSVNTHIVRSLYSADGKAFKIVVTDYSLNEATNNDDGDKDDKDDKDKDKDENDE